MDRYAWTACTIDTGHLLNDPGSASWDLDPVKVSRAGDVYTVTGGLRAKNGFGARVLSTVTCEVRVNDPGGPVSGVTFQVIDQHEN